MHLVFSATKLDCKSVAKYAKLFNSATEKRNVRKHISFLVTVCYQKNRKQNLQLKTGIGAVA